MLTAAMADSARYALASHLAVLHSCPDVISRLLKSGTSLLLAAKVLVLSRRLHIKLSQETDAPPLLEALRSRLGSLRQRLLSRLDRRFKDSTLQNGPLVEAMCAFSLATSSSAKDALRHFQHVRRDSVSEEMRNRSAGDENMLLALRLYLKTLKDSQAVAPGPLAHALEQQKSTALFKSKEVFSITELNLDIHERWLSDEVKTFTPYIRHDDLTKKETEQFLRQWAKQTFEPLLHGLQDRIKDIQGLAVLINLRKEILDLWLANHHFWLALDSTETLDGLRDIFNTQATRIIRARTSSLGTVGTTIQEILRNWRPESDSTPSLWGHGVVPGDMIAGAESFQENLKNRTHGKTEAVNNISRQYEAFIEGIKEIQDIIKVLRATRWVDDVDEVDDEDDLLDNKQVLLSEDDPEILQKALERALRDSFADIQSTIDHELPYNLDPFRGPKSGFLLRTWRNLRQLLPEGYQNENIGMESIPKLQDIIADEAIAGPLERCSKRLARIDSTRAPATRSLWEGNPELPILSSPWCYRFLLDLSSSMIVSGSDLWSTQAVAKLKRQVIISLGHRIKGTPEPDIPRMNGIVNGNSDPHKSDHLDQGSQIQEEVHANGYVKPDVDKQNGANASLTNGPQVNGNTRQNTPIYSVDVPVQLYFDISYLLEALAIKINVKEDNPLIHLQESLAERLDLESESLQRMRQDAAEFWKRTNLVFALLA